MLRPLDLVILLKLSLSKEPISQMKLAKALHVSSQSVNAGLKRAEAARLYNPRRRAVNRTALTEAISHGVRYFFAPERGEITRGVPTSWGAPPLNGMLAIGDEPPPVWPDPLGNARGPALYPLHDSVPEVVKEDPKLYELLALVDAIRDGTAREVQLAKEALRERLAA